MLNVDMSYCVFQQARNSHQIMEHESVQVFSIRMFLEFEFCIDVYHEYVM